MTDIVLQVNDDNINYDLLFDLVSTSSGVKAILKTNPQLASQVKVQSGTVASIAVPFQFPGPILNVGVFNNDDNFDLQISLDGSLTWLTIIPKETKAFDVNRSDIYLKSKTGETIEYEITYMMM